MVYWKTKKEVIPMGKRVLILVSCLCLLVGLVLPVPSLAAQLDGVDLSLQVTDREPVIVKGFQSSYDNNWILSLRDLASALAGTEKAFSVRLEQDTEEVQWILLQTGEDYEPQGGENEPGVVREATDMLDGDLAYWKLKLDDAEMRLPVYRYDQEDGLPADVYMRTVDLGMYLDLALEFTGATTLSINPGQHYQYDLNGQIADGYFRYLHSVVLADADTGEILYSHDGEVPTQIASTTKLMTYLLVKEAMDRGEFTEQTLCTVTQAVYEEANSEDGIYCQKGSCGSLDLGAQVTVADLLNAMLLRSANEAATALAELVAGSEAEFVTLMNTRAAELGLATADFYNPHGLPDYTRGMAPSKRQNEMSALDMFRLTAYLLEHHGTHLTAITSQTRAELPSFGPCPDGSVAYAKTTNALLYNLPECLGLKTGTTNRSGANLVSTMPVTDVTGQTHNLVVVLFGAEDDFERNEKSAWLLNYARQYYGQIPFPEPVPSTDPTTEPDQPETTLPETTHPEEPTETTAVAVAPVSEPLQGQVLLMMALSALTGVLVTLLCVRLFRGRKKNASYQGKYGR